MKHPALIAALALTVACSEDGRTAEGAQVLVPDAIDVAWDDRLNDEADGLGLLVPVDVMVYEGSTGEPLELVRLRVDAGAGSVLVDSEDVGSYASDCLDCVWDAGRDRYLLLPDATEPPALLTDSDGMVRIYVWIDAFPTDGDTLLPIAVEVDTEVSGATVEIQAH